MVNRVVGCQLPAGATPLLRFGPPPLPGVVRKLVAPGSASQKHPFRVVCVCVALVVVWWVRCWRWVVGLWASGGALRVCLVCWQRWLCMGGLPTWWV